MALPGLSLVAAAGGCSLGFSLRGFSCCRGGVPGHKGPVVAALRLNSCEA